MSSLRAVVSASMLKRWDRLAAPQLCERVASLAEENEELRQQLSWADECVEHWHDNAVELAGDNAGLTIDGKLVRLLDFDGRPFAHRDEYQRDAAFATLVRGAQ